MRSTFVKKQKLNGEMSLQITSMADIFMILLVFMLKGYAANAIDVTPTKGMQMPTAQAEGSSVDALKVEILESSVLVEGAPVSEIKSFEFINSDVIRGSGASKSLSLALEKARKRQQLITQKNADVKQDSRIIIMADERAPYSTIKAVLASAAVNGYTDFKLAVVNPN